MKKAEWLLGLTVVAILVATLTPMSGPVATSACLFCGDRGLADAIANILLFLPLGFVLGSLARRIRLIWLLPSVLSFCIEVTQKFVPGRDPSWGDVVFNSIGGMIGLAVARVAHGWIMPEARTAARFRVAGSIGFALAVAATGFLLQADLPPTVYWGLWMPDLAHLEWYRGHLDDARIGSLALKSGPMANQADIRSALRRGVPLTLRGTGGPPVHGLGAMFAIYDQNQDEILMIGPRGPNLVLRYRMHATRIGLDQPEMVLANGMQTIIPGQPFEITYRRDKSGTCLSVARAEPACGLAFSPGRAWSFIDYSASAPEWLKRVLDAIWLAVLAVPIGLWSTRPRDLVRPAVVLVFSLLVLSPLMGLHRGSLVELIGVAGGLGLGQLWRRFAAGMRTGGLRAGAAPARNRGSRPPQAPA